MFSGLRTSLWGAVSFGIVGLLLIGALGGAPAAEPPAGPDLLTPPNPEAAPPALPPVGGAAPIPAGEEQGEAQTRGAVHEAFAEPFDKNPEPTVIIPRKPPEPINEIAPDVKPEGDNVAWIPGYWGWDDERQDFVWISGLWRMIPPGRRWVPGYWVDAQGGFRWVNGMWAEDRVEELSYLPDPPASVEAGPNIVAPSEDHFWIPGCWMYGNAGYRWRAGYWSLGYDNWMWVPARYVWSPRGCFFVPGYWDYAFARRGVLFSPVYFRGGVYARPTFAFSPSVVVSLGGISSHLFVGVGFGHYYFGDYYGDACFRRGYYPWHVYHRQRCFDPHLNYYAWHHRRHDKFDYVRRLEDRHDHFVKHADQRPPKTYLAQRDWERRVGDDRVRETGELGRSLRDVQNRSDRDNVKLVKVADVQRREIDQHRSEIRNLSSERSKLERVAGDARVRGEVARGSDGKGPGAVGRPGESRVPGDRAGGDRDSVRRGIAGAGDAARADTAKLKLPKTTGAEQRAAIDRSRVNVPVDASRRGGQAVGTDGPRDGGSRGDASRRGVTPGDQGKGSDQKPTLSRDVQPRDSQPRTTQPRESQPRDSQPRDSQPRDSQPRDSQPRDSQPRTVQPRESSPRDSQPRNIQPRESQPRSIQPRESQPRGGGSGSRDSQPRSGSGSGRDKSGRSAISEDAPEVVKEAKPPVATKPREPAVVGKKEEAKAPSVVVKPRPTPETRLKPATEPPSGGADTAIPRSTRSTVTPPRTGAPKTAPPATGRSSRPSGDTGSPAPRSRGTASDSRSSSRSSGESRSSRTESSDSKGASKEKEEEKKSSSSGRGRGQ